MLMANGTLLKIFSSRFLKFLRNSVDNSIEQKYVKLVHLIQSTSKMTFLATFDQVSFLGNGNKISRIDSLEI